MDPLLAGGVLLLALFAVLASGLWVALALLGVGFIGMAVFTSAPAGQILATTNWGASNSWALAALPMFIWMGEILFRSRLSEDMFAGLAPWLNRLPGRLLHVNILGCGMFAAVCGSSAATAATIGRMSLPELERRGYDARLSIGTLAGSGTLGLLIPPSIILIVYGVAVDESIARLFVAGIIPGIVLVALFMAYVAGWALLNPGKVPPPDPAMGWRQRLVNSRRLMPIIALVGGVVLALVFSWLSGTLTWRAFADGLMGATRTSCMIAFILAGAAFLTVAMGFTGIPRLLAELIASLELSPHVLLAALTVFFILMGCVLDGISIVVLTTAVVQPMIEAAGIDRLWFGIYIVLVVEMAQITPPVGFNLFVLQGLTGRSMFFIARAAFPFFCILLLAIGLVTAFPGMVTYLPARMTG